MRLRNSPAINQPRHRPIVSVPAMSFSGSVAPPKPLVSYIDHTKLTYATDENPVAAIQKICAEAKDNHFFAVCVRPEMIQIAKKVLKNSGVQVATVIGFPSAKVSLQSQKAFPTIGDVPLSEKLAQAQQAIRDGADELDLVMNVRQFLMEVGQPQQVATVQEFKAIKAIAGNRVVKVILETDLLTPAQIQKATQACIDAGVDMVKTCTGMVDGGEGATVANIQRIHQVLANQDQAQKVGIKASGGIKTAKSAQALITAGATRLGTSQGVAIVNGLEGQNGY